MSALLFRLFMVAALLLMSLSDADARAHSQGTWHKASASHCPEQLKPDGSPVSNRADCTLPCTALPAQQAEVAKAVLQPSAPLLFAFVGGFSGIEPQTATPPPKWLEKVMPHHSIRFRRFDMSILLALTLAAAPVSQPAPATAADHSQHAQHQLEAKKHHDHCKEMMEKMHRTMHDGHPAKRGSGNASEHESHGSQH